MPSQTRNYLLFFLSFILIFGGYSWYRSWRYPGLSAEGEVKLQQGNRLLAATIPGDGLGNAVRLGAAANFNRDDERQLALAVLKDKAEKEKQAAAKPPEPVKPKAPVKPAETIALGGDDYYLAVTLTNRGAGVRDLTLTPFEAADSYGRPEVTADNKPVPLHLIPPSDATSFALYHYAEKDDPRPLDTLGVRDWQIVESDKKGDEQRVVFATELAEFGVRIVKTFTLRPHEYHLGLTVRIERLPGVKDLKPLRYQLAGGHGLPIEGVWYTTIFRNALFDWVDAAGKDARKLFDNRTIASKGGSDRDFTGGDDPIVPAGPRLQYAAVTNQFFASAIVTAEDQNIIKYVRATVESIPDPTKPQLDDVTVRTISDPLPLKAGESVEHKYVLYHGPIKVALLEKLGGKGAISPELAQRYVGALHLNTLTDYGGFGWWSNAIIFFTNIVHWLISVLRHISPNDALCIIMTTVLVRLAMMPISRRQQASMARQQEAMAKLKPEIAKLTERYKNDLVGKQQAQMELYRKHGINPAAGLGGCLMLLLQMPIFLGLYFALQESFFFRLQPFLWIKNLTAPDMLFPWSENIPFISEPANMGAFYYLGPYFNLLPIFSLTLMFIQMKWMQPPPTDEAMAQQQKMMQYIMIPMFAFLFYKMPSGLCLYFISTTLWGLAERKLLPKKKPATEAVAVATNGRPGSRGRAKSQPIPEPGRLRAWWDKLLKEASKK
jgi:YidC/Oxa1 family membrane protein insertase